MNHKQTELLDQVVEELKEHYPGFQIKVLREEGNTVRMAVKMPEDDDQNLEMNRLLAERLTDILVEYGYYFWTMEMNMATATPLIPLTESLPGHGLAS